MRCGQEQRAGRGGRGARRDARSRRRLLWCSVLVGCIALFPQALVPAAMKLSGDVARVWFLALYLPEPWQWPTIAFMALVAAGCFAVAWRVYAAARRP